MVQIAPKLAALSSSALDPSHEELPMSIVLTEDRGPVRHIVMNRPEKRNAMNDELISAWPGRFTQPPMTPRSCVS